VRAFQRGRDRRGLVGIELPDAVAGQRRGQLPGEPFRERRESRRPRGQLAPGDHVADEPGIQAQGLERVFDR